MQFLLTSAPNFTLVSISKTITEKFCENYQAKCWKVHKVGFGAPREDPKDGFIKFPMIWRFQISIL